MALDLTSVSKTEVNPTRPDLLRGTLPKLGEGNSDNPHKSTRAKGGDPKKSKPCRKRQGLLNFAKRLAIARSSFLATVQSTLVHDKSQPLLHLRTSLSATFCLVPAVKAVTGFWVIHLPIDRNGTSAEPDFSQG